MVLCVLQNQSTMELTHQNPTNRKRKRKHSAPARRPEFIPYHEDSHTSTIHNEHGSPSGSSTTSNPLDRDNEAKIIKLNEDIEMSRLPSFPHATEASPTPHPGKL